MTTRASLPFVSRVEAQLAAALELPAAAPTQTRLLAEASHHLVAAAGAKRFRPQLVQLLGKIYGLAEEPLVQVAAAAELIHAASLLHDDVIDAGTERRGRPTANVQWGNSVAVLAGDWLLTRAILAVTPLGLPLTRRAIETVETMTASAIREVESRGQPALTYPAWRSIAEGKSGELFAWCASAVAELAGAAQASRPLSALGRKLGVAFQMADDLKDLRELSTGKDRFADLRNRNPSFALVMAMEGSPILRDRISHAWREAGAEPRLPPHSSPLGSGDGSVAGMADLVTELGHAVLASPGLVHAQELLQEEIRASLALLAEVAPPAIVQEFVTLASAFAAGQAALLRGAA